MMIQEYIWLGSRFPIGRGTVYLAKPWRIGNARSGVRSTVATKSPYRRFVEWLFNKDVAFGLLGALMGVPG
jgi:hypothetical protein